jgi:pimeloyl-ACP methyl ester carboxylesterase
MTARGFARDDRPALMLVPGLPGRREWMQPAIPALSKGFRVLSFSLTEVPTDRFFDRAVDRLDAILGHAKVDRAVIAGVSFGGLVAALYAARHQARTSHLVLASAPSPRHQLDRRSASYVKRPTVSLPLFAARGAARIRAELAASLPGWRERALFAARFGLVALRRPGSPRLMAEWVTEWTRSDLTSEVRTILAPTLVVTGEAGLDRVVPMASSLDYLTLVPGARHVVMKHTGHLGSLVHPDEFATIVGDFVSTRSERAR